MIKFIHNAQITLMIAILAVSFFITYDFFITHISYKPELFLASTSLLCFLAIGKFILKSQMYFFIKKNTKKASLIETINPSGKKRILAYDSLVWLFMLALALFQTKLFGLTFHLVLAYYFTLILDLIFWFIFNTKFQTMLISDHLFLFSSRPHNVSLKNIKTVEKRFDDYYINYTTRKFSLLKTDLLSKKATEKVSVFFEKMT